MTRLNRMFPRIVKAEYELPAHVSAPCRDLLSRMLSVDTKRRCATCDSPRAELTGCSGH